MKSLVIKPRNEILKKHIQYFLFFNKENNDLISYTTFPNNNLCLAIYKENDIDYVNDLKNNNCVINKGNRIFTSKFYGFHKMSFNVSIKSCLDQICIIFKPSALRAFTKEAYTDIMKSDSIFDVFTNIESGILEQLFEEDDFLAKANKLELFLLTNLINEVPDKMKKALQLITKDNNFTVDALAKELAISNSSLFRLFKNHLGQNPKSYLDTIRFRNSLNDVLKNQNILTDIAHLNEYFDQAHFINNFKSFSGYSPTELYNKISVQQNKLAWIYNEKQT
jgi:AraC-like DNA-binding protein